VTYDDTSKPLTPGSGCLHNYQAGFGLIYSWRTAC